MKELEDMFEALAQSSAEARASGSKDKAAPSPSLTDDDISTDGEGTSYETDTYQEWLEWEEFVSQQEGPGANDSNNPKHHYEALVCVTENAELASPSTRVKREGTVAPSMPCILLWETKMSTGKR